MVIYEPRSEMTRSSGFQTRSHTNRAVQSQKMARGLKFQIKKEEGLYYLCSENKGADQLSGLREADLRLCFRICKKPVFSQCGSYIDSPVIKTFFSLLNYIILNIKLSEFGDSMRLILLKITPQPLYNTNVFVSYFALFRRRDKVRI